MKLSKTLKISLLVSLALLFVSQAAIAGIKERMNARLPVIADLKTKGIIGENNQGYLGFVTENRTQQALIAAENKDRKAIYSYFAKQQNTTLETVEKIQAARKAKKAKPGEFVQNPDGAWVRK